MNRLSAAPLLACLLLVACGDDSTTVAPDVRRDITERDVPDFDAASDAAGGSDAGTTDGSDDVTDDAGTDAQADAGNDDAGGEDVAPDTAPDTAPDGPIDDPCDQDNDGFRAEGPVCGGNDCNDTDGRDNPDAREGCDFADNNCNGVLNDGIDCEFYAHTADGVYLIDPFNETATLVVETPGTTYDFDTAPDGTLYALADDALYRFDDSRDRWVSEGELRAGSFRPNGLAINSRSVGFATGGNDLYRINLESGAATYVGSMGREGSHEFDSSGDCVIDKNDVLYMSSRNADRSEDYLVRVDAETGDAEMIGSTGYRAIFGLTAAWGYLFGMTSSGELLLLDPGTGAGELLHTFEVGGDELRWYGSASSPGR